MKQLIVIGIAILVIFLNIRISLADKVEDAYFISSMQGIEQVTRQYRENLKNILEGKEFKASQDCEAIKKGGEWFQTSLILINEIEVTPKLGELQRLYKVLLRERRALTARLLEACISQKLTKENDRHIEKITERIDLYSYQVDNEGKKNMDYVSELHEEISTKELEEFDAKFNERVNKKLQGN